MPRKKKKSPPKKHKASGAIGPLHQWRQCPIGEHWVRPHTRNVPPNESHEGYKTKVSSSCRPNPSHKDVLYLHEIARIAETYFSDLSPLSSNNLGYSNGDKYNELIAGWTKYWNEVLNPKVPLDPYLVKALIASESDFNPEALPPGGVPNSARDLMQVTNDSRKYLADEVEDLRDFLVVINKKEITDPNLNIAAGVRWLFRKKQIVESKNRNATWRDVVVAYKRYQKDPNGKQMKKFDDLYKSLLK